MSLDLSLTTKPTEVCAHYFKAFGRKEENNSIILCLIISEVTTNKYKFQTITISSFVYLPMIIENMFHSSSCSPTNIKGLHIRWAKIGVSKQFDRKPVLISFCRMAAKKFAT